MAELRPCAECRRHVSIDERVCPFCSAELIAATPTRVVLGRASRAAVFASAALATTACGPPKRTNIPPAQQLPDAGVRDAPTGTTYETPPDAKTGQAEPEPSPVKMPYGAPPARRRVV
ncbi:MAG TPA: hypothetical protein VFV99_17640 [Kofleriaceae bacterium]|nr:hypothetical protein [Kofleriaceae bacterium]